jgi:hypothetical protein
MKRLLPSFISCLLAVPVTAYADSHILKRDPELAKLIPHEALEGPGAWESDVWLVATGQSIRIDSLGETKGRRTEAEFAEDDAKLRLARLAAALNDASFDPEMYELQADMKGVRVAATYRLDGRDTLFLTLVGRRANVHVKLLFSPDRARKFAQGLYTAGDWKGAAKAFAALNSHGIQDAETTAWARAASARVNLEAGVIGDSKLSAWKTLAVFHDERKQWDTSLKFYHQIYIETDSPDRPLCEKLANLAELTDRPNNAEAFRKEIQRRWPTQPASPAQP